MIGVVIDGCPAGVELDMDFIHQEMERRRPGQSSITTQRRETDKVTVVAGVFEGKTTGAPIAAYVLNENQREKDYDNLKEAFRPSHADFTYFKKYGIRDHRGGGRSSARETAARVIAGAIAKLILQKQNIWIQAYVSKVGTIAVHNDYTRLDLSSVEKNIVRCPDPEVARQMIEWIDTIRKDGDTIGGVVSCVVKGAPAGLGEPVFDRLQADLGKAMLSINAAKGFEYGGGFGMTDYKGSQMNDPFRVRNGRTVTESNNSGGIQGGISNGMDIYFNVAFKPVSTIMMAQQTVNAAGEEVELKMKGRHDPCVLPRAVPIVEAMAAIVMVDHLLRAKAVNSYE
jgi:chorismate synthase